MQQIIHYIQTMLPYMLASAPLIVMFRLLRVKSLKQKGAPPNIRHEVVFVLFVMFLVGLATQTVIPFTSAIANRESDINLIPFAMLVDSYKDIVNNGNFSFFIINLLGNIVMFMPIGFCVPLLWHKMTLPKTLLIGSASSLFIELCQLPQARKTDIDDLILNTLGALLGWLIYRLLRCFFANGVEKYKLSLKADKSKTI